MPLQFQYSTLTHSEDVEPLGSILDQCFLAKPGDSEAQINRLGMENMRLIRQSEQIVGGLATIPMGQWYGGQRVPMMGIAAVGIAPQYRGTGAAIALMQHTLNELPMLRVYRFLLSIQRLNAYTAKQGTSREVISAFGNFQPPVFRFGNSHSRCNL